MGAYASSFKSIPGGQNVADYSSPNQADWITAHATATGLAIVEVERLWIRFQQLGCNEQGVLAPEVFRSPHVTHDVFMKNILLNFKGSDGTISFQTFIMAMKWAETSSQEDKIRGVFRLINMGDPVPRDLLEKVLRRTYPSDTDEDIKRIADVFMTQMDKRRQGYLDEEQFVQFVLAMPMATIVPVLDFHMVPPEINAEAHRAFTALSTGTQNLKLVQDTSRQIPTDATLRKVATKISNRDWHILGNKLDFTAADLAQYEARDPNDNTEQVYNMLTDWREREGPIAYCGTLERALRNSGMNDVALLLHP